MKHKETIIHGHDRHNTTTLSIIHKMSPTCFGEYYLYPSLLAAITTPQYQPAFPSRQRHPIDTSSNNGDLYEIIDVI